MMHMTKDNNSALNKNTRVEVSDSLLKDKADTFASYIDKLRSGKLVFLAPLSLEAMAIRKSGALVKKTGMGKDKSLKFAEYYSGEVQSSSNLIVLGIAGGCDARLQPGDILIANTIYKIQKNGSIDKTSTSNSIELQESGVLSQLIQYARLEKDPLAAVRYNLYNAPIGCSETIVKGEARKNAFLDNIPAVEMESFWLAPKLIDRSGTFHVIRVVLDTPDSELFSPTTLVKLKIALSQLRQIAEIIQSIKNIQNLENFLGTTPS